MSVRTLSTALALVLSASALASGGSNDPYKTEIDCNGTYMPGDVVDYQFEIEDRANRRHDITWSFEVRLPGGRTVLLNSGSYTITRNETTFLNQSIEIPANVPNGRYTLIVSSDSAQHSFSDTCSFHVQ